MPCPRCGAESAELLQTSGGRATCRRCGASVVLAEPVELSEPMAAPVQSRRRIFVLPLVVLGLVLLISTAAWGLRGLIHAVAARGQRDRCAEHLHKIAVALKNYADEHSVYPPAIIRDSQGRPLHSWRVLILPQLGSAEEELHREYHYHEPWNSPHNRELAGRMPEVYRCPEDPALREDQTSYVALVDGTTGDFAAYPSSGTAAPQRPAMTAYVVMELADSGVYWMEPKDISLGSDSQPDKPLPTSLSYHVGGSVAVDADGATVVLPHGTAAETITSRAVGTKIGAPER